MTRLPIELTATPEDHRIARLAAFAIGLAFVDAAIPSPLPGIKPGLANIITLVVLQRFGLGVAIWVSMLRIVAGSLLFGTFLTPTFVLSLSGGACSLLVLACVRYLPARWFGPVTQSVCASFAHIAGQLAIVYVWLIPHAGLLYLVPFFATAALVFGTANGLAAGKMLAHEEQQHLAGEFAGAASSGRSLAVPGRRP